jgi:hypothetical protein
MKLMTFLKRLLPDTIRSRGTLRSWWIINHHLLYSYGWLRSMQQKESVDAAGNYLPYITYPAIDYLAQFDLSDKKLFEYGAGASTAYWSKRVKEVVSIESDAKWLEKVQKMNLPNVQILLSSTDTDEYAKQIKPFGLFDMIVIDGIKDSRIKCAKVAQEHLAEGGMIILDNSDLFPESAKILRSNPMLIQVDFIGLGTMRFCTNTTSIFMHRNIQLKPLGDTQPQKHKTQLRNILELKETEL